MQPQLLPRLEARMANAPQERSGVRLFDEPRPLDLALAHGSEGFRTLVLAPAELFLCPSSGRPGLRAKPVTAEQLAEDWARREMHRDVKDLLAKGSLEESARQVVLGRLQR